MKIAHLYPEHLNLYGDFGNVLSLSKRLSWRAIEHEIVNVSLGDKHKSLFEYDLFFIGGGQDSQQEVIAQDIFSRRNEIYDLVEAEKPFLAVCGGYQLLGKYYQTSEGHQIEGLNILDIITIASPQKINAKQDRLIGNISAQLLLPLHIQTSLNSLVGFENHSGRTFIVDQRTKPLAKVIKGFGNNGEDAFEGAYYKNLIGTYIHGSLLPKNPHLADEMLWSALKNNSKYLSLLDDDLEKQAHQFALKL